MKISSTLTIFVFLVIIIPLTVGLLFKPADAYSEDEQRNLQQLPNLTADTLLDGSFGSDMNTYMNDQFPLRDLFVGIKSKAEMLSLKRENNGVLSGSDGQLAVRLFAANDGNAHPLTYTAPEVDYYYKAVVSSACDSLKSLSERFAALGKPFSALLPPRTVDVASAAFAYPDEYNAALRAYISDSLTDVNYVDMTDMLRQKYDAGEYVYYKTDHHWTSLGAYYAYAEVMRSYSDTPYALDAFTRTQVSDSFLGTTYAKGGFKDASPDTVEFFGLAAQPADSFSVERPGDKKLPSLDSLYWNDALSAKNKYTAFLGGTSPYIRVTADSDKSREKLLVLGDSYALSLIPFLALHYDVEFVRLGDWGDVFAAYGAPECDRVLVVWNLENLVTTTDLSRTNRVPTYYGG